MDKPIPQKRLGRSGLVVSRLALGTMMFGQRAEATEAKRIFDEAVEAGVNFVDTADSYAGGRSEEIMGSLIAGDRHKFVLATKIANAAGPGPNQRGLSRKWIIEAVERSLKRLGTDFIDILFLHKEDHETPMEETIRALAHLQQSGAVRYFGLSNYRGWRIAQFCAVCDREGVGRPVALQPLYHALNRSAETELFPACDFLGLGIVAYSPMARGVLTGKYSPGAQPDAESRAGQNDRRIMQTEYRPENIQAAQAIAAHARKRGIEPGAFAVAWALANPLVTAAIAGPRSLDQWRGYRAALAVTLTDEDEAFVDSLVGAGSTAIPQFQDPTYPVEGRPRKVAI